MQGLHAPCCLRLEAHDPQPFYLLLCRHASCFTYLAGVAFHGQGPIWRLSFCWLLLVVVVVVVMCTAVVAAMSVFVVVVLIVVALVIVICPSCGRDRSGRPGSRPKGCLAVVFAMSIVAVMLVLASGFVADVVVCQLNALGTCF